MSNTLKFSNKEIAKQTNLIFENFQEKNDLILPIKVNYALQYNYKELSNRAELFDTMKQKVLEKYGEYSENTNAYTISKDKLKDAQNEFDEFLNVEQEIKIITISLDDLENCKLTSQQMQTLLFMID